MYETRLSDVQTKVFFLLKIFLVILNIEETESLGSHSNSAVHGLLTETDSTTPHNGNNNNNHLDEPMDINENSVTNTITTNTNGSGTNGCSTSSFTIGTPPTSTTIVQDFDDFEGFFINFFFKFCYLLIKNFFKI